MCTYSPFWYLRADSFYQLCFSSQSWTWSYRCGRWLQSQSQHCRYLHLECEFAGRDPSTLVVKLNSTGDWNIVWHVFSWFFRFSTFLAVAVVATTWAVQYFRHLHQSYCLHRLLHCWNTNFCGKRPNANFKVSMTCVFSAFAATVKPFEAAHENEITRLAVPSCHGMMVITPIWT